ncbi:hypothetical protein [Mucilaginibacter sp. FT3.2]|uniref:hypothetical protein n=1 Tax=Mucilaginibacter sp. FT3.2 TaxID=2723090 RepID=UPI0016171120|nr:hypothetical protein [Mucilaginibacter sp. FT3.2]MBB6233962.1 hypothetical protein [Mucilaginibacter sp. FT3.2]
MDPAQVYSFKVWLTMVIVAPILQALANQLFLHSGDILSIAFVKDYPLQVGVLIVLTCPLGALLTFMITRMSKEGTAILLKKRVSIAMGIVIVLIFIGASLPQNSYSPLQLAVMLLPFLLPMLLGVWICRLELQEDYEDSEETDPQM